MCVPAYVGGVLGILVQLLNLATLISEFRIPIPVIV